MRWRNWWCCAAVGAAAVGGISLAQPVPGDPPLPALPSGPLSPTGGPLMPGEPPAVALPPAGAPTLPPMGEPQQPDFRPAQPVQPPAEPTLQPLPAPAPVQPPRAVTPPPSTPPLVAPAPTGYGQPMLSVKQTLPTEIPLGQPVTAEVTVTNAGTKAAENVVLTGWWTAGYDVSEQSVVSQSMNGRRAWGMGAIAAGESRTVKMKLVPAPNTPATTEFRSGFDATFSSTSTDTRSIKVLKPELKVSVTAPEVVFVGQPVPVQIRVTNSSAIPVGKVVVQSFMAGSVTYPKLPSGTSGLTSDAVTLLPGAADVIPLDLSAVRPGEGKVTVRVSGEGADAVTHEIKVIAVEARTSVTLHGPKSLYQNWPGTFEAVIENQGEQAIRGAQFEVKLPSGLTDNLRASDKPGYDAASNRLVWKLDVLQPGEKKTVIWFGYSKQTDDLTTTATVTIGGMPLKRAEWVTKNLGAEAK